MDAPEFFDVGFVEQLFFGIVNRSLCFWDISFYPDTILRN